MIKPLNGKILIRRLEKEEKTSSGIILKLSENEADVLVHGVVIDPGSNTDLNGLDTVLYYKHMGVEVTKGTETYYLLRPVDIVGVIEE